MAGPCVMLLRNVELIVKELCLCKPEYTRNDGGKAYIEVSENGSQFRLYANVNAYLGSDAEADDPRASFITYGA